MRQFRLETPANEIHMILGVSPLFQIQSIWRSEIVRSTVTTLDLNATVMVRHSSLGSKSFLGTHKSSLTHAH
jgi:hypothetical protein